MPIGEGWWLNYRTDESVPIYEHWEAVQADPHKFGVADLDAETLDKNRQGTLEAVLKNGWIRVRSHKGSTVYETWRLTRRAADAIALHMLQIVKPGPFSAIQINIVSKGRGFAVRAGSLYADLEAEVNPVAPDNLVWKIEHVGNAIYLLARATTGKD